MSTFTNRTEYVTRDAILKLLSDEETARVSAREGGPPLVNGDEYLTAAVATHSPTASTSTSTTWAALMFKQRLAICESSGESLFAG